MTSVCRCLKEKVYEHRFFIHVLYNYEIMFEKIYICMYLHMLIVVLSHNLRKIENQRQRSYDAIVQYFLRALINLEL